MKDVRIELKKNKIVVVVDSMARNCFQTLVELMCVRIESNIKEKSKGLIGEVKCALATDWTNFEIRGLIITCVGCEDVKIPIPVTVNALQSVSTKNNESYESFEDIGYDKTKEVVVAILSEMRGIADLYEYKPVPERSNVL